MPKYNAKRSRTSLRKNAKESSTEKMEIIDTKNFGMKTRENFVKNEHQMLRSFNLNSTLDKAFDDMKANLRNEANNSPLIELTNEITKELDTDIIRDRQFDECECSIPYNFRSLIVGNDDSEKKSLVNLMKKFNEEEKQIKELLGRE